MNKKDIELIAEAASKVVAEDRNMVAELEKAGWCKDKDWPDPKKLHSADSEECQKSEDAEGSGVVYIAKYTQDYECDDIAGIYTDMDTAMKAAKAQYEYYSSRNPYPEDFGVEAVPLNKDYIDDIFEGKWTPLSVEE